MQRQHRKETTSDERSGQWSGSRGAPRTQSTLSRTSHVFEVRMNQAACPPELRQNPRNGGRKTSADEGLAKRKRTGDMGSRVSAAKT